MKFPIVALLTIFSLMSPIAHAGETEGFRLTSVQKGSVYEKLGLQKGDVIKSVNGVEIKSAEQAASISKDLKSLTSVEIVIERKGKEETLRSKID